MVVPNPKAYTQGSYRYFHRTRFPHANDTGMRIWKQEDILFVEAIHYASKGKIRELLRCLEPSTGLFKLISRTSDTSVPISTIIKRNQQFPLQALVCMKMRPTNV